MTFANTWNFDQSATIVGIVIDAVSGSFTARTRIRNGYVDTFWDRDCAVIRMTLVT